MNYARLTTLFVVLAVALAGCAGGGPVSDDGGAEDGSDGSDGGVDDGSADGDASDGSDAFEVADSDRLLRDAGSFTAAWSFSVTDADGVTSSIDSTYRVDLDANRSVESFSMAGPDARTDFETFYADGTTYTRYGDGEETFYQVVPQEGEVFETALARGAFGYDSVDDAEFVGTETFDGVTVDRYEYADTEVWRQYGSEAFNTNENVTVSEFTVVVLLDEDGLARQTAWSLTGETDDGQTVQADWEYTLTDVGSTTVEDPAWLEEAMAQQSGSARVERPARAPQ